MFDIGFTELLICGVIALVVLGPERMPALARKLGRITGQARGYMRNLNAEIDRELHARDLKETVDESRRQIDELADSIQDSVSMQPLDRNDDK